MERRDFRVKKTEEQFLNNYKLHDKAELLGNDILHKFGYQTIPFGEDRRHEIVWEAGRDKPDCFIIKRNDSQKRKICMLEWKAKRSDLFRINERAYISYARLTEKMELRLIIALAVFKNENLSTFKYFLLPDSDLIQSKRKEWDGNYTVVFNPKKAGEFRDIDKKLACLFG